jgi:hypothetical protein
LPQLRLAQHQVHDTGTVAGAVGDHGPGKTLEFRLDGFLGLGRRSDGNKAARSLAYSARILFDQEKLPPARDRVSCLFGFLAIYVGTHRKDQSSWNTTGQ